MGAGGGGGGGSFIRWIRGVAELADAEFVIYRRSLREHSDFLIYLQAEYQHRDIVIFQCIRFYDIVKVK